MTKYVGRHRAQDVGRATGRGSRGMAGVPVAALASAAVAAVAATADAGIASPRAAGSAIGGRVGPVTQETFGARGTATAPKHSEASATGNSREVIRDVGGRTVQRFTASVGYGVNLRSAPTLRTPGTVVAKLPAGTPLKGTYNSTGYWFKVTAGHWAGRWVASSLVQKLPNSGAVNGRIPMSDLARVPRGSTLRVGSSPGTSLSPAAAHAFTNMNAAFRARFGHDIGVVEGYRTLATQQLYAKRFGYPRAAVPGTSNHGLGNAVDIGEPGRPGTASPFYFGRVYDKWLTENGWKWGFDRPSFMDAGGTNPESWHYNFVG